MAKKCTKVVETESKKEMILLEPEVYKELLNTIKELNTKYTQLLDDVVLAQDSSNSTLKLSRLNDIDTNSPPTKPDHPASFTIDCNSFPNSDDLANCLDYVHRVKARRIHLSHQTQALWELIK